MKKNITINLCGRLFAIDEDAYELLEHYLDTIRRHYKKLGTEEVADDIENRVAELFDEVIAAGANAITIEKTKEIIKRIGEIEELTADEGNASSDDVRPSANGEKSGGRSGEKKTSASRRLYRDNEDCMLAGVLSGIGKYFGMNVSWVRLGFIVLELLSFVPGRYYIYHITNIGDISPTMMVPGMYWNLTSWLLILLYFLMVIVVPKARTPEDRLRMEGKEVTPQNIAEEVARKPEPNKSGCLGMFLRFVCGFLLFILGAVFCILLAAFVIAAIVFFTDPVNYYETWFLSGWHRTYGGEVQLFYHEIRPSFFFYVGGMACLLCSLIFCCFRGVGRLFGVVKPLSWQHCLGWVGGIFLFLAISIYSGTSMFNLMQKQVQIGNQNYRDAHVHHKGEFEFSDEDFDYFKREGWTLVKAENLDPWRYTDNGNHYSGDYHYRYLDAHSYANNIVYQAEKVVNVEAGTYTLKCAGRSSRNSHGVYAFAVVEKDGKDALKLKHLATLPNEESSGGELGRGWSTVTIENIVVPTDAVIRYGISTDSAFTGESCTARWFSACDFVLERQ